MASLVAAYPNFTKWFFVIVGAAVAVSVAINIVLYFEYLAPKHFRYIGQYRLKTSIGMRAYANSTNISATYAVYFMGTIATVMRGRLPPIPRAILALCAAILLVGVLLTQARSALLGVLVGLAVLALTASSRIRLFVLAALLAVAGAIAAVPTAQEAMLSARLELSFRSLDKVPRTHR